MDNTTPSPARRRLLRNDLEDLLARLETAVCETLPAVDVLLVATWAYPNEEDKERQRVAEELLRLRMDLRKLRPLLDELGLTLT